MLPVRISIAALALAYSCMVQLYDAAIEAADSALMADDLAKVEEALSLGRRGHAIRRHSIAFSICILAILIPAAVGGLLSVAAAIFTHEVRGLLAVANGLRARSTGPQAAA